MGSNSVMEARYAARLASPFAKRNSVKVMGLICTKFTLPTGKEEGFARAIPGSAPAQAILLRSKFFQPV